MRERATKRETRDLTDLGVRYVLAQVELERIVDRHRDALGYVGDGDVFLQALHVPMRQSTGVKAAEARRQGGVSVARSRRHHPRCMASSWARSDF